jgi:hypothetical protein
MLNKFRTVGSEKIENVNDKLARIKEMAGITNSNINEDIEVGAKDVLQEVESPDGRIFGIVQSGKHVYIKEKREDGKFYFSEGIENYRHYSYKSYADALKNLNLILKEVKSNKNITEEIDLIKKKV